MGFKSVWYEKEYTFFKNVALRLQIPLCEMNRDELAFVYKAKLEADDSREESAYIELNKLFQMSSNNEIICLENPAMDLSCFSITIPSHTYDKILLFGPVQRKDFKAAHGLITEFAEAVWKEPCSIKTYSVDIRKKHPLIETVVQYVEEDVTANHTLRSLAKELHVSPGHLSKLFTQEMGITLTEYVNRKKVAYGAYLLSTTDEKITVIASMCGIKDNNYFSRLFKKYVGICPAEYRKKA